MGKLHVLAILLEDADHEFDLKFAKKYLYIIYKKVNIYKINECRFTSCQCFSQYRRMLIMNPISNLQKNFKYYVLKN